MGYGAAGFRLPIASGRLIVELLVKAPKDTVPDSQLVRRVQQGDKRAFDLLVLKYQHRVRAIVGRYIRDHGEVDDVVQESFIKAYRALGSFRGDSQFYTWLYRIAVNTAKNFLVARSRRPPASDVDLDDAEHFAGNEGLVDLDTPENLAQGEELRAVVEAAIRALPEDLRVAITLREFEGLSYEDIAGVMKCPVGTVRSRIFRAREAIDARVEALMRGES